MSNAPVVLFTYNRPEHTRLTVEALQRNVGAGDTDLYIYSDGPKGDPQAEAVAQVRAHLRTVAGFKAVTVVERERNMGLAASVIAGVTATLALYPNVIVVEDDMLTSANFLSYMNDALRTYQSRQDIFSVTGYNYPLPIPADYPNDVYLSYRSSSWGWGTWADRWSKVDWAVSDYETFLQTPEELALFARAGDDMAAMLKSQMTGNIDSWSIRFDYAHYKHNAVCLHAIRSKVQNIGFDGSGVHCAPSEEYQVELDPGTHTAVMPLDLRIDPVMQKIFNARFRPNSFAAGRPMSAMLSRLKKPARRIMRSLGIRNQESR